MEGSTVTTRDLIRKALADAGPDGLGKAQLERTVSRNHGVFRSTILDMIEEGEVTVTPEEREYGQTAVHRLASVPGMTGQEPLPIEDAVRATEADEAA